MSGTYGYPSCPTRAVGRRAAATFIDRLRPSSAEDADAAAYNVQREIARLTDRQHEAAALRADVLRLLSGPGQQAVYAESGVRSGFGFWLELKQRLGRRLLPPPQAEPAEGFFSDNYFDIIPGQPVTLTFKPQAQVSLTINDLKVRSLVDTY